MFTHGYNCEFAVRILRTSGHEAVASEGEGYCQDPDRLGA